MFQLYPVQRWLLVITVILPIGRIFATAWIRRIGSLHEEPTFGATLVDVGEARAISATHVLFREKQVPVD